MSTTSIAVERTKLRERVVVEEEPIVVKPREESENRKNFNLFMGILWLDIVDMTKSVLFVFAALAVCKFSGLYSWWIQLVNSL